MRFATHATPGGRSRPSSLSRSAGAAFAPLFVGESRVADLAGGLYLAAAAVGLAFSVGVAGLPLLAQGAFMAIGAVTAAHLGSTALGAGAVRWPVVSPRRSSGRRSRGCRRRGSRSRAGSSRGSSPSACSRSAGRSAGRRESWSPEARHRPSTTSSASCSHCWRWSSTRRSRGAVRAPACRGPRTRACSDGAAGSDRAAADQGARRVGHVCGCGRSARASTLPGWEIPARSAPSSPSSSSSSS